MKLLLLTCLLGAASLSSATTLFVASYAGTVASLSLTENGGSYSLNQTFVSNDCAPNPSWLTLDANRGLLFCLNEGLETVNGSLSSFKVNRDGSLVHVQNTTTISGPVSGVIYGAPAGGRAIALAHYTGSALSSWHLNGGGNFSSNQNIVFALKQTGPVADRQEAPHEHEAILDPTGRYLLVPDLGADLVRVFSYDDALMLQELNPLQAEPGDGPRHAAFYNPYGVACEGCTTFLYVVNELGSTVKGYAVTYEANGGGLSFEQVYNSSTYGYLSTPEGNAPSEIQVSPDNRFLIVGNRNDSSVTVPNLDPTNSTQIQSDTISTFALNQDGSLNFVQLAPAYGSFPRQFSTNAVGNLLAVGLQQSSEVVILRRDITTGLIGQPIASISIEGQITCVLFNEEHALGTLGG
ncbi:hypothetical protein LTR70_006539 [Exophiala xenobiotica]|uniref:Uncharacterized protein n=1 Tax=Lithohypha guttulata TaxID=1690604 RepID=A0ABR0K8U8_9EURO|nr:hypothetical protein LTR24_006019 [Lithohypha guttulata]KAK5315897.1 hypothetical protein LTR70_006539 [Exophiala xenobiotica]